MVAFFSLSLASLPTNRDATPDPNPIIDDGDIKLVAAPKPDPSNAPPGCPLDATPPRIPPPVAPNASPVPT